MSDLLHRECRTLTRYLINREPSQALLDRYVDAHAARVEVREGNRFDRAMVAVARMHPWATRLADSYAVILRPRGLLRQKLVLLLAMLESAAPGASAIDAADGPLVTVLSGTIRGLLFPIWFAAGVLVFVPVRLVVTWRGG